MIGKHLDHVRPQRLGARPESSTGGKATDSSCATSPWRTAENDTARTDGIPHAARTQRRLHLPRWRRSWLGNLKGKRPPETPSVTPMIAICQTMLPASDLLGGTRNDRNPECHECPCPTRSRRSVFWKADIFPNAVDRGIIRVRQRADSPSLLEPSGRGSMSHGSPRKVAVVSERRLAPERMLGRRGRGSRSRTVVH